MVFEVFGVLLAAVIQGVIISIYGSTANCDSTTLSPKITLPYSNSTTNANYNDELKDSSSNKLVIKIKRFHHFGFIIL